MWKDILARINVVDLVMVGIVIRSIYIGFAEGFVVEAFKLLGALVATFVVLHYFYSFALLVKEAMAMPVTTLELFSFIFLWMLVTTMFSIVRSGWILGFKVEKKTILLRLLGLFLSVPRAVLVCGLTFVLFFLSGNKELEMTTRKSLSAFYILTVSSDMYGAAYDQWIARFFPEEPLNVRLFEIMSTKGKDDKKKQ